MDVSKLADKAGDLAKGLADKAAASGLTDKAADLAKGLADKAGGAGAVAEKAGALLGTVADKVTDKLPEGVQQKAAGLADKAVDAATTALGAAADKLSKK